VVDKLLDKGANIEAVDKVRAALMIMTIIVELS
jgi:hypothetical protein